MKTSQEIRKAFFDFWTETPRNFKIIENVSLVPNVDSTLLYVNSGMFPLAPYLAGAHHPLGTRLCNFQRCLRTNYDEMIEIGDNRHTLMFEMMGDWSLGDFTKADQIPWILELLVERYGLDPSRVYVTVFAGDDDAPRDDEAIEIWKKAFTKYGIDAKFSEDIYNVPTNIDDGKHWAYRIFPYPKRKNWWERAHAKGELGGPTSEIFYDLGQVEVPQEKYHVNDDSGRFIEIGNNVFMEYSLDEQLRWIPLTQKNIDFGGGFERIVMIAQDKADIFETDIYEPIIRRVEEISGKPYKTNGKKNEWTPSFRIIADHVRAAVFILGDGIKPSNKDQGYILRRFIRRLIRFGKKIGIEKSFVVDVAELVIDHMGGVYPHLAEGKESILENLRKEELSFAQTLNKGLREIEKYRDRTDVFTGETAFWIYETFGFPIEMIFDELAFSETRLVEIQNEYDKAEELHREKSRAGLEKKFRGGLADTSDLTTRLHTAHHLLLAALREVLGAHVHQRGSNITAERLRIDFSHDEKLSDGEVELIEKIVNEKIQEGWQVVMKTLPREKAEQIGAEMEFGAKYGDLVSVYFVLSPEIKVKDGEFNIYSKDAREIFSKEFCGGPHVSNTSELSLSGKFKIVKQESVGVGTRRIKAVLG